ncbi:hypothetical protein GOP47_0015171 [Adiantum capillus-veneris]|uniref:UVR domain-containing protein n=1 Tax=Adiantum capillus-veneris TaxID=13818 RepID=A0A9D4UMV0_ADICA|nr:hypothetical protein GOP47_0015171 [Adiantum capillus-veneris]
MPSSAYYDIPCYVFPAGGHFPPKMEMHGTLCVKGGGFSGQRIVQLSKQRRQLSVSRCLEGSMSEDLDNKVKIEKPTQVDEYALEAKLREAVESENYTKAAELRDRLRALQDDNRAGVRAANAKFYEAFMTGNMKEMREVWCCGDNAHCIHPGAGRISGYDMVIASWELMLGPDTSIPLKIELHNLDVQVKGNMGYVTCLEVVRTSGSSWGKQLATNIFEKQNGTWYICVHHASHITI